MRETMPEDGQIDAAASYRDPCAVPLRDAAKLLDLDYSKIFDDTNQDELPTDYLESGRYRIIGYAKPRRLSDEPMLVERRFVKAAFQDLQRDTVFDPVHDRVLIRPTGFREPTGQWLAIPGKMEEWREWQRLMALPPAINWTGCAIRAGRYSFVSCKVIRAEDLADFVLASGVAEAPKTTGAEELQHDLPPPDTERLAELLINLFIEEPSWYKAGDDRLAAKVAQLDPRFQPNTGPRKVGRWKLVTLKQAIKNVRKEARDLATELRKKSLES